MVELGDLHGGAKNNRRIFILYQEKSHLWRQLSLVTAGERKPAKWETTRFKFSVDTSYWTDRSEHHICSKARDSFYQTCQNFRMVQVPTIRENL
jgi:hypothetical protein